MTINKLPTLRRVLVEKLTVPELVKKFPTFMEPKGWSLRLQDPATCLCPDQVIPHPPQPPTKTISWKSIHLVKLRWYTNDSLSESMHIPTAWSRSVYLFIYLFVWWCLPSSAGITQHRILVKWTGKEVSGNHAYVTFRTIVVFARPNLRTGDL